MSSSLQQTYQKHGAVIAKGVTVVIVGIILFILAKLVWLWIDYFQSNPQAPAPAQVTPQKTQAAKVNPALVTNLNLFGQAQATAEPQEVEAEETNLNLKLLGTYVSTEDKMSSAIILSNGSKQKVYMIGEKLQVSGQVSLHKVEPLRVTIKNGGKYETLTLIEQLNQKIIAESASDKESDKNTRTIDKRKDSRLAKDLSELREKLYTSPQSLAGLAKIERMVDATGQVAGFKIAPGKDKQMFTRLGLRRGDVLKSVNGTALNEQGYLGILDQINSAESLEVTLERNGQPVTLLLGFGGATNRQEQTQERPTNEPQLK